MANAKLGNSHNARHRFFPGEPRGIVKCVATRRKKPLPPGVDGMIQRFMQAAKECGYLFNGARLARGEQARMAREIGGSVTDDKIGRWLSGDRAGLDVATLVDLAHGLGVRVGWLICAELPVEFLPSGPSVTYDSDEHHGDKHGPPALAPRPGHGRKAK